MTDVSEAARRLQELRETARLSRRLAAEAAGLSVATYQHYETRFTKDVQPLAMIRRITPLFVSHGIPAADLAALAGVDEHTLMTSPVSPQEPPDRAPLNRARLRSVIAQGLTLLRHMGPDALTKLDAGMFADSIINAYDTASGVRDKEE